MSTLKAPSWSAVAILVGLLTLGCATSGWRPSGATALLGSRGTIVESIDEQYVRGDGPGASKAQFEIPPGRHAIEVSLETDAPAAGDRTDRANTITVCFNALAGQRYVTQAIFEADRWQARIVDTSTGATVSGACAETPDSTETASAVGLEQKLPPASLPVPSRPRVHDPNPPGSGLTAGVGFFFGGESLYTVSFLNGPDRNLNAGRGVLVTVGGLWTPLWIEDQIGFGAGASAGWKFDSIEAANGSISLTRFPLTATVHGLIPISRQWFALVSAGLTKEMGGTVSGTGFAATASGDFTSSLGLLGEGALYARIGQATLGGALRYSTSHDVYRDAEFDASSLGIIASAQYNF
jgi:hypothetical protein